MSKSAVRPIDSSKNKLNSEIIYNFNPHPNTRLRVFGLRLRFHADVFLPFFFFFFKPAPIALFMGHE